MEKRVLVTGACGFAGRHTCEYLAGLSDRPTVIGVDVLDIPPNNCDYFYTVDLSAAKHVDDIIKHTRPDFIIHLAGTFGTGDCFGLYKANVLSIIALLQAVSQHVPEGVIVAAGSAAEYGCIRPDQLPVGEETLCEPVLPYGLTKYLATQIALYYHRVHNICVMVVRPFQLVGKGASARLAPGAFAQQLKQAVRDGSKVIKVGNLESYRDFLDVRDAVEGFWALCQNPVPGEIYNLCSGKPTKIADLLQVMIQLCGVNIEIEVDHRRTSGGFDVPEVYGSYHKINNHCAWQPKRNLVESLETMIECE